MGKYLISGINGRGKRATERIEAASAAKAVAAFGDQGFTEIRLHTDDTSPMNFPDLPLSHDKTVKKCLLPEDEVRSYTFGEGRLRRLIGDFKRTYRPIQLPAFVLAFFLVLRRVVGILWQWPDTLMLICLAIPLLLLLTLWRKLSILGKAERAVIAAHWNDLLVLAPQLRRMLGTVRKCAATEFEAAVWQAKALAGLGRMQEAITLLAEDKERLAIPHTAYLKAIVRIHSVVNDVEAALECAREWVELAPNAPLAWLTLADLLSRRPETIEEAWAASEKLKSFTLAETSKVFVQSIDAGIAFNEGRFAAAKQQLEVLLPKIEAMSRRVILALEYVHYFQAMLAIACAKTGDRASALKYFREARPYLVAHKWDEMLERCRKALPDAAALRCA